MSKIVKAINAMVSNQHLITNAIKGTNGLELFFIYDARHKWSITKHHDGKNYSLHYYPGIQTIETLAEIPEHAWDDFNEIVSYHSRDLGTQEALDSISELYTAVQEKLFAMNDVLDNIINSDPF